MNDAPGILPYALWVKFFPDGPGLWDLTRRYAELLDVVERCRVEGWVLLPEWLMELGVA